MSAAYEELLSIYKGSSDGTLTAKDLSENQNVNFVHPTTRLTPLGVATWFGHVKQVELLLAQGANPNGTRTPGDDAVRPPLWVATSRTEENAGQIVQTLLRYKADASLPSTLDDHSTPLIGAVKTGKSPEIISALVDAGASPLAQNMHGETAHGIAERKNDRRRLQAMLHRSQRHSSRLPTLFTLSGLLLFIVAWANMNVLISAVAGGVLVAANIVKSRFHISGVFDSMFQNLQVHKSKDEFKTAICEYIGQTHLGQFFPPGDKFLERVVDRAVELERDPNNTLNVRDLCRLALYQPVIYCDDSRSMDKNHLTKPQNELVQRIASITTRLVPDDTGIEIRFINTPTSQDMSKPSLETIDAVMSQLRCTGWSEIGTNLERKVLHDMVYTPLQNGTFRRPVLISIITDGEPRGETGKTKETPETLKNVILQCVGKLRNYDYDPTAVRFQISQIGSDQGATDFLTNLNDDPDLKEILYCTTDRLDKQFEQYRENAARLEQWLLKLLMGPILDADSA